MLRNFWYILAESWELKASAPLSRELLGEHLVLYRDSEGKPVILPDRCLHRCGKLSKGRVAQGNLHCPYHGWVYGAEGKVVEIPSEGCKPIHNLGHTPCSVIEQEGYIYVCLKPHPDFPRPYSIPHYGSSIWKNYRMQNRFQASVTNCVENFIDVPHTAFVHEGIFRKSLGHAVETRVKREKGMVEIEYRKESSNIGSMSWFLNPSKGEIIHIDRFIMPNITHVIYRFPSGWEYLITSQSIPVRSDLTLVYTDITYNLGFWTPFAGWMIKHQAQKTILQDMEVLKDQQDVIARSGNKFTNMPCDIIHRLISEIRDALEHGIDPRTLPDKTREITFFV